MMADMVFFATRRTEVSLLVVAPYLTASVVEVAETRLATLLAARASV
jgi:hypothetical protein